MRRLLRLYRMIRRIVFVGGLVALIVTVVRELSDGDDEGRFAGPVPMSFDQWPVVPQMQKHTEA
ncbi:MAG: hypothetical protein ACYDD4_00065 [Acidimicrobiales bacterium]